MQMLNEQALLLALRVDALVCHPGGSFMPFKVKLACLAIDYWPTKEGNGWLTAVALASHLIGEERTIIVPMRMLALQTRQSVPEVREQLQSLVDNGWIEAADGKLEENGQYRVFRILPAWIDVATLLPPIDEQELNEDVSRAC